MSMTNLRGSYTTDMVMVIAVEYYYIINVAI